jgi:hypothetical protein
MKISLMIFAPVAMLALAACNKSETADAPAEGDASAVATPAAPVELPPSITASGTYRCADNTILFVDFLGANVAADIRVGDKTSAATRVEQAKVEAPLDGAAPAAPSGPLKSADGETSLSGSGKQINVKLAGKGAQTCKGS